MNKAHKRISYECGFVGFELSVRESPLLLSRNTQLADKQFLKALVVSCDLGAYLIKEYFAGEITI